MRLAAPLAFALAMASSVEEGVLDRIRETGTVRFGYRADAAPLSYLGEGKKPAGYSVLVCGAVAESLGRQLGVEVKADWQPVTAEDRFDAVAEGRIDLLCGAATITLARRERVDFSLPTFVDGAAVLLGEAGVGAGVGGDVPARGSGGEVQHGGEERVPVADGLRVQRLDVRVGAFADDAGGDLPRGHRVDPCLHLAVGDAVDDLTPERGCDGAAVVAGVVLDGAGTADVPSGPG